MTFQVFSMDKKTNREFAEINGGEPTGTFVPESQRDEAAEFATEAEANVFKNKLKAMYRGTKMYFFVTPYPK